MKLSLILTVPIVTFVVSACAALTQMQDTAAKFDQGVHTVSSAETGLFNQVQAAECSRNFYVQGFNFATALRNKTTGQYPELPLDLRATACVHQELTDVELAVRQRLMQAITLYADAIQTLTNGTSDTNLNDDAQTLAVKIKDLGTQQQFTSTEGIAGNVLNAAVVTIATMIIDHSSYKNVKAAATAMQTPLSDLVEALKYENSADTVGLASKADLLTNEMRTGLLAARDNLGPASFLEVVTTRATLQSLIVTLPNVAQLNSTLDSVVKANAALAHSTNGGAIPEISDLISRAQQASTLFNASK
jgi:hypothetical protein